MNGYKFTKEWFAFCASQKDCTPIHTALYLWLVEQNNLAGWHPEFTIDRKQAMQNLNISSIKTYRKTMENLVKWRAIEILGKAKNQYSVCQIALVKITQAEENAGVNNTQADELACVKNAIAEEKNTQTNENAGVNFTQANGFTYSKTNINKNFKLKLLEGENTHAREEPNQKKILLHFSEEEKKKSSAPKRKEEFSKREAAFKTAVENYAGIYPPEILQVFFDYWSEPDAEGNMRYELEPTWELSRRLDTWMRREKQFNNKNHDRQTTKFQTQANGYAAEELDYTIPL